MGAQATKIQALETQLSTQTTTIEGKFADLNSAQATHIQALEAQLSTQTTTIEGQATAIQTLEANLDAKLSTQTTTIEARPHFEPLASQIRRANCCVCVQADSYKM